MYKFVNETGLNFNLEGFECQFGQTGEETPIDNTIEYYGWIRNHEMKKFANTFLLSKELIADEMAFHIALRQMAKGMIVKYKAI